MYSDLRLLECDALSHPRIYVLVYEWSEIFAGDLPVPSLNAKVRKIMYRTKYFLTSGQNMWPRSLFEDLAVHE